MNLNFIYKTVNFIDAMVFLTVFKLMTKKQNEKETFYNMSELADSKSSLG